MLNAKTTTSALRAVEEAIGEQWDGLALLKSEKNPAAVALGRLGGAKGGGRGPPRSVKKKRSAIAKKAALARWGKPVK